MLCIVGLITNTQIHYVAKRQFSSVFAKLRKETIRFVMSVRPSAWNNSTPQLDGFSLNLIFEDSSKICREIKVSLKSDIKNGHFTLRPVFVHADKFFQKEAVEKITTHILCSITSPTPRKSCRL